MSEGYQPQDMGAFMGNEVAGAMHTRTKSTMSLEREYMHATTWLEYG